MLSGTSPRRHVRAVAPGAGQEVEHRLAAERAETPHLGGVGGADSASAQTDSDEAAAALLRVGVVAEAEGLRLHLSSNSTGYRGVYKVNGRFQAVQMGGKKVSLGCFGTAVEAAVAYARAQAGRAGG